MRRNSTNVTVIFVSRSSSLFHIIASRWDKNEPTLMQFCQIKIWNQLEAAETELQNAKDLIPPPERDMEGFYEERILPSYRKQQLVENTQRIAQDLRRLRDSNCLIDEQPADEESLQRQLKWQCHNVSDFTKQFILSCFDEMMAKRKNEHLSSSISLENSSLSSGSSPTK